MIPDACEDLSCTVSAMAIFGGTLNRITCLDRCVVPELLALWEKGIETVCSCCGHGDDSEAYIRVKGEYAPLMLEMGYEPYEQHTCYFHKNSVSFRAKTVAQERAKPRPEVKDPEAVQEMWRERARMEQEMRNHV